MGVEVDSVSGLLADYAREKGAVAIIKGLRAVSDYEYEFQMALANKQLNPEVETMFLPTRVENMFLSSSLVTGGRLRRRYFAFCAGVPARENQ